MPTVFFGSGTTITVALLGPEALERSITLRQGSNARAGMLFEEQRMEFESLREEHWLLYNQDGRVAESHTNQSVRLPRPQQMMSFPMRSLLEDNPTLWYVYLKTI